MPEENNCRMLPEESTEFPSSITGRICRLTLEELNEERGFDLTPPPRMEDLRFHSRKDELLQPIREVEFMQSFRLMGKRRSLPLDDAVPTINTNQIQPLIDSWRTVQTAGFSEHEVRTHMSQLFMNIIMNFSDEILSGVGKVIAQKQFSPSDALLSEDAVKDALRAVLRTSFKTSSADEYYALEKVQEQISAEVTVTVNSVLSRMGSPGSKLKVDKEQGYTPSRHKLLSIVSNAQKFMQCCWPCRTEISGEEKPVDKELQERAKRLKIRNELRQNGLGVAASVETANLSQHDASGISSFAPEIQTRSDSATSETQVTQVESLPAETEQEATKQTTHSSSDTYTPKIIWPNLPGACSMPLSEEAAPLVQKTVPKELFQMEERVPEQTQSKPLSLRPCLVQSTEEHKHISPKKSSGPPSESLGDMEKITKEILSENQQQKAMKAAAQQKRVTQSCCSVFTCCSFQMLSDESSQSSSEEDSNVVTQTLLTPVSKAASQASIASALEQVKEVLDEAAVTVARSSSLSKDEAEVLVSKLSDKSEADAVSIYSMILDDMDEYTHSLDSDELSTTCCYFRVVQRVESFLALCYAKLSFRKLLIQSSRKCKVSADIETMEKEAACHLEKLVSVPDDIQEEGSFYEKLSQDISHGQHKDVNEALRQVVVQNMSPRNSIGAWKFGRKVTRSVLKFLKSVKEWVDKQEDQEPKRGEVRNTYQKLRKIILCMSMDPQTHYTGTHYTPPQPTTADVHFEWEPDHIRVLAYEVTRRVLQTKSLTNVSLFVELWQRLEENMTQWNVKVRPDAENILDVAKDVYKDLCSGFKKQWVGFNCLINENYIDTIIDTIRCNLEIPKKKSRISSFFRSVRRVSCRSMCFTVY